MSYADVELINLDFNQSEIESIERIKPRENNRNSKNVVT